MSQRSFVRGAMLLAAAAVVSKLLGSIYTIILQNIIGDHGMGLFQMAYPIYATLLAIATAGFPVAISKVVSERIALGDAGGVRQAFRVSRTLLFLAGIVCFAVLYFGADTWARISGDQQATFAIRAIAPALLVVPLVSVIRGYFQGFQWMEPTAISQVIEQAVRVTTIIGLAVWLMHRGYGSPIAAAGAAFGAVTGALAGLLALAYFWSRRHPGLQFVSTERSMTSRQVARQLIYFALPISLGALVVPLMNNVDVVTVVNLLKGIGESQTMATTQFGLLTGRAFKLMMLPTTLAAGIGIAVMPAISEAFTLGFRQLMQERIDTAIRLTMMLALPASIGLFLLAKPIDIALFRDTAGATTIQWMALATVFASLQTTLAAVLQGAGWVYTPVINLCLAGVVKFACNMLLVPQFGIDGAAVATVASYFVATWLNMYAIRKRHLTEIHSTTWFGRPLLATFVMSAVVFACVQQWQYWGGLEWPRLLVGGVSCIIIGVGMVVYLFSLIVSGAVQQAELVRVPRVGPSLAKWAGWLYGQKSR